jgi:hypothetical protein
MQGLGVHLLSVPVCKGCSFPGAGPSSQEGDIQVSSSGLVLFLGWTLFSRGRYPGELQRSNSDPRTGPLLRRKISMNAPVVHLCSWGWTSSQEKDIHECASGPTLFLGLDSLPRREISRLATTRFSSVLETGPKLFQTIIKHGKLLFAAFSQLHIFFRFYTEILHSGTN